MNEVELIARLTRSLPTNGSTVVGPGDDCALIDLGLPDDLAVFPTHGSGSFCGTGDCPLPPVNGAPANGICGPLRTSGTCCTFNGECISGTCTGGGTCA